MSFFFFDIQQSSCMCLVCVSMPVYLHACICECVSVDCIACLKTALCGLLLKVERLDRLVTEMAGFKE